MDIAMGRSEIPAACDNGVHGKLTDVALNRTSQWWLGAVLVAAAGYVFTARNAPPARYSAEAERERLRRQLASVDLAIKQLMTDIARVQMQEDGAKDALARASEQAAAILSNLQRAADGYDEMLSATGLDP